MQRKKPTVFIIFAFILVLSLAVSITANAEDTLPPRDPNNPVPVSAPAAMAETLDLLEQDTLSDIVTPNVIGGNPVSPQNKYPWMVSQQFEGGGNFCGGTLISPEWVLTSAHCWVYDTTPPGGDPSYEIIPISTEKMVLGEYRLSDNSGHEQRIAPAEIFVHPNFDIDYFQYDIALIRLSSPAVLNDYVYPITLSPEIKDIVIDYPGYVAGWGATAYYWDPDCNGGLGCNVYTFPDTMQHAAVNIMSDAGCKNYGFSPSFFPDSMICAGTFDGSKDTCYRDSGGPLMAYNDGLYEQVGITSFGLNCAVEGFPGIYASVYAGMDWVKTHVGLNVLNNPSSEYMKPDGWEWLFTENLQSGESADCGTGNARSGSCSFKWVGNGNVKSVAMRYNYSGSAGDSINFSLFRKGENISTAGSVFVKIVVLNTDGSIEKTTKLISGGDLSNWASTNSTLTPVENYKRIDITIVNSLDSGTLWLDDLSLKINGGSEMLTTPDVETFVPDNWQFGINLVPGEGVDCGNGYALSGSCSFGWNGNSNVKSLALRYPNAGAINGKTGDNLYFSLFRKGQNIPATGSVFIKFVIIHNDGSTQKVTQKISGGDVSIWENFAIEMTALEDYKRIDITIVNSMTSGRLWMDNFVLTIN